MTVIFLAIFDERRLRVGTGTNRNDFSFREAKAIITFSERRPKKHG
jgi:hypothetical protein